MTTKTETKPQTAPATMSPHQLANYRAKPPKEASFGDIFNALQASGDIAPASDFGTGFSVLDTKEKGRLVGVPLLILEWDFHEGDNGEFVSLQIVTQANEKLVINDGSTGICKQMKEISEAGNDKAIYVAKGLRRSDYDYTDKDGSKKPATTYYLDTSA